MVIPPPLPDPPPSSRRPTSKNAFVWLLGALVSDAVMGGLYALVAWLTVGHSVGSPLVAPSLFLVPFFGGLLASLLWRRAQPSIWDTAGYVLGATFIALIGAALAYAEGVICLIIVSPLFYGVMLAGALVGRVWFRSDMGKLRVSFAPLAIVALAAVAEPHFRSEHEGSVTDMLVVRASPSRVWRHVTSFPPISAKPDFWMFRIGLPYPVETTSAGDFVGADRRCIFSGGAVFREVVSECVPSTRLTFDMVELPDDPELIGHLTPRRGQFELRDNGDGTTTLVGTTWYSLHVHPRWYFDGWTQHIFRAVHLRVMEDVKRRAEQP